MSTLPEGPSAEWAEWVHMHSGLPAPRDQDEATRMRIAYVAGRLRSYRGTNSDPFLSDWLDRLWADALEAVSFPGENGR